ncbi:MAG: amino acid racemase [Candidatus Woesearchaeota archaeon]|jgi:aspartate racemase
MKTIGILAGMGPKSTAPFIDLVVNQCQKQYGAKYDEDFPHLIIYSLPTPFFIDKPIDHEKMKKVVLEGLKRLESFDVDFIAIPCNTVHTYFDYFKKSIKTLLLNIVEETLKNLDQKKHKIAVLATVPTVESKVYQKGIDKSGSKYISKPEWQTSVNDIIKSVKAGEIKKANLLWKKLLQLITKESVDTIIIGCTDLNVLDKPRNITFIDSTDSLAKAVVKKYLTLRG